MTSWWTNTVGRCFGLLGILAACGALGVAGANGQTINEIRIDQPGTDNDEYFELAGTPGTLLDGLTYIVIGDSTAGLSGVVEVVVSLNGLSIPTDGYFLAVEDTFTLGGGLAAADLVLSGAGNGLNFENSDNVTHMLVRDFAGTLGQDLDTNNDCILDITPWSAVLDLIALIEENNPPTATECHYGPPTIGPEGGNLVPGHVYRLPNGSGGWNIGPFDPVAGNDTPGVANTEPVGACCMVTNCSELTAPDCATMGGAFLGVGTSCTPNPCQGACCVAQTCTLETAASCLGLGGTFFGGGTQCLGSICTACQTPASARTVGLNTPVRLCDVVISSTTDLVSSNLQKSFQVQDATGGVTVFGANAVIDFLLSIATEGDRIDIEGTTLSFSGLFELADGFRLLNIVAGPVAVGIPAPTVVTTADFQNGSATAEALESTLVTLECVEFATTGTFAGQTNYTVTDGTNTATVRVSTNDLFPNPPGTAIPVGPVKLVGIFSQFDSTGGTSGYQLLLRGPADIQTAINCPAACATTPGDMDGDGDVDGDDMQRFIACLLAGPVIGPGCACADMNNSGDLTLADVPLFAQALTP